jgi:hypothetical protein
MGFTGITVDSIVGDDVTGVQSMFPRFTFDADSTPTLAQIQSYAEKFISAVGRQVTFKGYDPATLVGGDDLMFVRNWIELKVAAEIHIALDQFKDNPVANARLKQLEAVNRDFAECEDPFPTVGRASRSNTVDIFPQRLVRVRSSEL